MGPTSPAPRSHSNGTTGLPWRAWIADDASARGYAYWWAKLSGRPFDAIMTCGSCLRPHAQDTIVCIYLADREAVLAPLCPACDALMATGRGDGVAANLERLRPLWRPHALPDAAGGGVVNVLDLGAIS